MARPERTNLRPLEQRELVTRAPNPAPDGRPDLREALEVIRLRRWSIALVTALTVSVALFFSTRQIPTYASQAKVLVNSVDPNTQPGQVQGSPNMATEAALVSSDAVARVVAENLHYEGNPSDLLSGLSVDSPTETEILEISDTTSSAREAQLRAQGFATGYLQYRGDLANEKITEAKDQIQEQLSGLRSQLADTRAELAKAPPGSTLANSLEVTIGELTNLIVSTELQLHDLPQEDFVVGNVIQPASRNSAPVGPNHMLNAALGLIAGLALGIGIAFLRDRLAGRLRSPADIEEQSGMAVLASIPRIPGWRRRRDAFLVTRRNWQSPASEAYRMLRTALSSGPTTEEVKSILVTSAQNGEGKTTTVANLAMVFASVGKRVTVVSADLRRPRLGDFFGVSGRSGLADVLQGRISLDDAVVEVPLVRTSPSREVPGSSVLFLPSGSIPEHPAELLASEAMGNIIETLEGEADILLIDSPPLLSVTDALVMAPLVGGVLVVIGPGSATRSSVRAISQQLDRAGVPVTGVALNCFEAESRQTYAY